MSLFTPVFEQRHGANKRLGEEAIRFQGEAGWGVMQEATHARLEKARQNRAGLHGAHGRGLK